MALDFKHHFIEIMVNCNYCSKKKDATYQVISNEFLNKILKLSREDSEEHKIALVLSKICGLCDLKEPRRSRYLESYGINID